MITESFKMRRPSDGAVALIRFGAGLDVVAQVESLVAEGYEWMPQVW